MSPELTAIIGLCFAVAALAGACAVLAWDRAKVRGGSPAPAESAMERTNSALLKMLGETHNKVMCVSEAGVARYRLENERIANERDASLAAMQMQDARTKFLRHANGQTPAQPEPKKGEADRVRATRFSDSDTGESVDQ